MNSIKRNIAGTQAETKTELKIPITQLENWNENWVQQEEPNNGYQGLNDKTENLDERSTEYKK